MRVGRQTKRLGYGGVCARALERQAQDRERRLCLYCGHRTSAVDRNSTENCVGVSAWDDCGEDENREHKTVAGSEER